MSTLGSGGKLHGGRDHQAGGQAPGGAQTALGSCGQILVRILGVFVVPALVMLGVGRIAPNPDGVLVLALACVFGAGYYLKPEK